MPVLRNASAGGDRGGPSALQERLRGVRDPRKRYKILCEALAQDPDSFEANEALLYHGRLHEPLRAARGGGIDYSLIKCHLFSAFDTPEKYSAQALREKYDELLRGEPASAHDGPGAGRGGLLRRVSPSPGV